MVAAVPGVAGHRGPGPGGRIPHLGVEHGAGGVVETGHAGTAGHEHPAVGQDGEVVLPPGAGHAAGGRPQGSGGVQVNQLGAGQGRITAAGAQHLAHVVEDGGAVVVPARGDIRGHGGPGAAARGVEVTRRGGGEEHPAVGREERVRIERQRAQRVGQVAPGAAARLPDLRQGVIRVIGVIAARGDEHVTVGERGARGVPAAVVHVRQARPGIGDGVVNAGVVETPAVLHVAARDQHASITQVRVAGAEDVVGGLGQRGDGVVRRIPETRIIAVGVDHHLAGPEHDGVDGDDGPVGRGGPGALGGIGVDGCGRGKHSRRDCRPDGQRGKRALQGRRMICLLHTVMCWLV
jgi:hypothetical protein